MGTLCLLHLIEHISLQSICHHLFLQMLLKSIAVDCRQTKAVYNTSWWSIYSNECFEKSTLTATDTNLYSTCPFKGPELLPRSTINEQDWKMPKITLTAPARTRLTSCLPMNQNLTSVLWRIDGVWTRQNKRYDVCILPHVVPYGPFVENDFIFMQDNARPYTARTVRGFITEVEVRVMD